MKIRLGLILGCIILFLFVIVQPVSANHLCGMDCDQHTEQGACTHGCTVPGTAPNPDFRSSDSDSGYKTDDAQTYAQNVVAAQETITAQAVAAGASDSMIAGVLSAYVDVNTTEAAINTVDITQTNAAVVSPEVQSALADQTSRCSPELHLCPMIDPKTQQVVGWVPATQAVYGTFEDAKLARLNVSLGNLNESTGIYAGGLTPNDADSGTAFRKFTTEALDKGLTDDEKAHIAQLAEQNMVKINPDGTVKKDTSGNIVTNTGTLQVSELHQREQTFQTEQTQAADNAYQRVLGGLGCTQLPGTLNCDSNASTFVIACAKEKNVPVCSAEELKAYLLTIPEFVQLRGNVPKAKEFATSIEGIAKQTAANALVVAQAAVFDAAITAEQSVLNTHPCRGDACDVAGLLNSFIASVPNYTILSAEDRTKIEQAFLALAVGENTSLGFAQKACKQVNSVTKCDGVDAYISLGFARDTASNIATSNLNQVIDAMTQCAARNPLGCSLNLYSFDAFAYYPNDSHVAQQLQDHFNDQRTLVQSSINDRVKLDQLAKDSAQALVRSESFRSGERDGVAAPIMGPPTPIIGPPAPPKDTKGAGSRMVVPPNWSSVTTAAPVANTTTTDLTPLQQLQLSAAQASLNIIGAFNNTGFAQGINQRASDLGVINAPSADVAIGRFLNTTTGGFFGNYAATYANINAQNPNASLLERAFNPSGIDASASLLAHAVTAVAPDGGVVTGAVVDGLLHAPLFGATRWINGIALGVRAASTGNLETLAQANAYNLYNISGAQDVVDTSNRLIWQSGMTPEQAEAYRNSIQCGENGFDLTKCRIDTSDPTALLNRVSDAFALGTSAVAIGDVAASAEVIARQAIVSAVRNGATLNAQTVAQGIANGVATTVTAGPLSQQGVEQALGLFAKGFQNGTGNAFQRAGQGLSDVYSQGMPATQSLVNRALSGFEAVGIGGGGSEVKALALAIAENPQRIAVLPDIHSMSVQDVKDELFRRGMIDADGKPLGGVFIGDLYGKASTELVANSPTQSPGSDLLEYITDLVNQSDGKMVALNGNWDPRMATAVAAHLRGDSSQLQAILGKTLPLSEVNHVLSSAENLAQYLDRAGQLQTVVPIGNTVFSHTDTAQDLLYSLTQDDLQKLAQTNPDLAEEVRYLINQQKYSGHGVYDAQTNFEILDKANPELASQAQAVLDKYKLLPGDTKITPDDKAILASADKIIKQATQNDRLLNAQEVQLFNQAYRELDLSPKDISSRINANVSEIITQGVGSQNIPGLNGDAAYRELQTLHANMSEDLAFFKDPAIADAYAEVFGANTLAFGHTPVSAATPIAVQSSGLTQVAPGVWQTNAGTLLYDTDVNLSTGMRVRSTTSSNGFLPVVDGVIQFPEDPAEIQRLFVSEGPMSVPVTQYIPRPAFQMPSVSPIVPPNMQFVFSQVMRDVLPSYVGSR